MRMVINFDMCIYSKCIEMLTIFILDFISIMWLNWRKKIKETKKIKRRKAAQQQDRNEHVRSRSQFLHKKKQQNRSKPIAITLKIDNNKLQQQQHSYIYSRFICFETNSKKKGRIQLRTTSYLPLFHVIFSLRSLRMKNI